MSSIIIHPLALCESISIGEGTRIWPFSHVLAGAQIGKNCNICEQVYIESEVIIGNNCTIKNGVSIWNGITLGDGVFIGPNVTFTNDRFPRAFDRRTQADYLEQTVIETGATIGGGATLLPGIRIGAYAFIGAGAVVTKSVPAHAVVYGNPAKIIRYVDSP